MGSEFLFSDINMLIYIYLSSLISHSTFSLSDVTLKEKENEKYFQLSRATCVCVCVYLSIMIFDKTYRLKCDEWIARKSLCKLPNLLFFPFSSLYSHHGKSDCERGRSIDNEIHGGSKQIWVGEIHTSSEGHFQKDRG